MKGLSIRRIAVCSFLLVGLAAFGQEASDPSADVAASGHFAAGRDAFEAEDYARALAEFQAAVDSGEDGPAIRYNLAVTHYRLGDYAEAEDAFRALGERYPSMRQLADYNVGLALTKQSRLDEARAAFEQARGAPDERVAALAAAMLGRIAAATGRGEAPAAAWTRFFDARLGHDDNVALIDTASLPAGRSTSSPFAEALFYVGGTLARRWRLDASGYLVTYSRAGEYDQGAFYLGLRYEVDVGAWRVSAGPQAQQTTLDGDGFERQLGAVLDVRRAVTGSAAIGLSATYESIDAVDSLFAYVDGDRTQLRALYEQTTTNGRVVVDYRRERDDRAGPSVNAERDRFGLRYRRRLAPSWTGEARVEYRTSDHALLAVPRDEQRRQAGFEAVRAYASGWRFNALYRYERNESSDAIYTYTRHRFSVGLSKAF